jgi:hypothetical protein
MTAPRDYWLLNLAMLARRATPWPEEGTDYYRDTLLNWDQRDFLAECTPAAVTSWCERVQATERERDALRADAELLEGLIALAETEPDGIEIFNGSWYRHPDAGWLIRESNESWTAEGATARDAIRAAIERDKELP